MSTEPEDLRGLPPDYSECIRLPWERKLEAQATAFHTWAGLSDRLNQGVPLSQDLAPRVHRLAAEVATSLRSNRPYAIFQCQGFDPVVNAQALNIAGAGAIRLIGPVARLLTDDGLRALLGHEFGHLLAHGPAAKPPSTLSLVRGDRRLIRCASMAKELTADRFGLLACRSFRAWVEVEIVAATGEPFPERANAHGIAEECRKLIQNCQVELLGDTHPTSMCRIYAIWLFWQSDVYRRLTGLGPGTMALADINRELEQRLTSPSFPTVDPPPAPSKPPEHRPRVDLLKRFDEFVSQKKRG